MVLTMAESTGSPALTIWPKSGSPPSAKTDDECAAAAQKPTGRVLTTSAEVEAGRGCESGHWRPHSLTGFEPTSHRKPAYAAHTPSCMVETVIVMPARFPPTESRAALLYSLYFVFPMYQKAKYSRRAYSSLSPFFSLSSRWNFVFRNTRTATFQTNANSKKLDTMSAIVDTNWLIIPPDFFGSSGSGFFLNGPKAADETASTRANVRMTWCFRERSAITRLDVGRL
mmetsp:Transcript_22268/g.69712  ORF Transcript_22268/g.69712 Transcript_22268/m.69712 type:complete len:227 (-) Transcript_22268:2-682(-)